MGLYAFPILGGDAWNQNKPEHFARPSRTPTATLEPTFWELNFDSSLISPTTEAIVCWRDAGMFGATEVMSMDLTIERQIEQ